MLGFYLTICLHLCFHYKIYHHISLITNAPLGLTDADAKIYAIRAISLALAIQLVVAAVAHRAM